MYSRVVILLSTIAMTFGAPNHLKTVIVDKEVPPSGNGIAIGSLGASASWGGYSAGAGLGGGAGGGGLYAGASAPQGSAGAGLGGGTIGGASASAGGGVKGTSTGVVGTGGFFDGIFNIPISVLHSVRDHLNHRGKTVSIHGAGNVGTGATASASAGAEGNVGYKSVAANAGTGGAVAGGGVTVTKNYDSAFAIPIAALTSVNKFLNGK